MSERSQLISKLLRDRKMRFAYIKAKLGVLVPSQIRALRLRSGMPKQSDLAKSASMQQSRISLLETPGASNVTLETLASLAATFKVGLAVKFVPFSEMLQWENSFSQDSFNVLPLNEDTNFLAPSTGRPDYAEIPSSVFSSLPAGVDSVPAPEQRKGPLTLRYVEGPARSATHSLN